VKRILGDVKEFTMDEIEDAIEWNQVTYLTKGFHSLNSNREVTAYLHLPPALYQSESEDDMIGQSNDSDRATTKRVSNLVKDPILKRQSIISDRKFNAKSIRSVRFDDDIPKTYPNTDISEHEPKSPQVNQVAEAIKSNKPKSSNTGLFSNMIRSNSPSISATILEDSDGEREYELDAESQELSLLGLNPVNKNLRLTDNYTSFETSRATIVDLTDVSHKDASINTDSYSAGDLLGLGGKLVSTSKNNVVSDSLQDTSGSQSDIPQIDLQFQSSSGIGSRDLKRFSELNADLTDIHSRPLDVVLKIIVTSRSKTKDPSLELSPFKEDNLESSTELVATQRTSADIDISQSESQTESHIDLVSNEKMFSILNSKVDKDGNINVNVKFILDVQRKGKELSPSVGISPVLLNSHHSALSFEPSEIRERSLSHDLTELHSLIATKHSNSDDKYDVSSSDQNETSALFVLSSKSAPNLVEVTALISPAVVLPDSPVNHISTLSPISQLAVSNSTAVDSTSVEPVYLSYDLSDGSESPFKVQNETPIAALRLSRSLPPNSMASMLKRQIFGIAQSERGKNEQYLHDIPALYSLQAENTSNETKVLASGQAERFPLKRAENYVVSSSEVEDVCPESAAVTSISRRSSKNVVPPLPVINATVLPVSLSSDIKNSVYSQHSTINNVPHANSNSELLYSPMDDAPEASGNSESLQSVREYTKLSKDLWEDSESDPDIDEYSVGQSFTNVRRRVFRSRGRRTLRKSGTSDWSEDYTESRESQDIVVDPKYFIDDLNQMSVASNSFDSIEDGLQRLRINITNR